MIDDKKRKRDDEKFEVAKSNKIEDNKDIKKESNNKSEDKPQTEEEKKKARLLAWKKTQELLGLKNKNQNEKKVEEKKQEKEEDTLDSYMKEIKNECEEILANDEKKFKIEKTRSEIMEQSNKESNSRKGLDDEEEELNFTKYEDKTPEVLTMEAPKKKLFDVVDHTSIKYLPFRKNFYIEVEEIKKMTDKELKKYRRKLDHIKVTGNCPKPIKTFSQCGLNDRMLKVLKSKNYIMPTPIQCQAIPALMKGEDVIGIAKTGSGKTLAFLLPMFRHILDQPPLEENEGPIALLMAPTRELALQIHQEAKAFCRAVKLRSVCVYGGGAVQDQISKLKRGAEIVVATPGRMIEILSLNNGRITNLQRITYVVLDEADRMFDMGFEPQIMRIISNIRPDRQTCMFSATFPQKVELLARKALKKPVAIVIGGRLKVSDQIEQNIEIRSEISRFSRLIELLEENEEKGSIIVFVDKQESADVLFRKIMEKGFLCDSLHGGKDQLDRLSTIEDFKSHKIKILIATSIAARGLDVKDLNLVINYEMPNHIEDYVHRVGRTGRAGKRGVSYTFVDPDDDHFAPPLVRLLKSAKQKIPEDLEKLAKNYELKKSAGIKVNWMGNGYEGNNGYKFDNVEASKKSDEVKKHLKALGLNDGDEPEDSEEKEKEKEEEVDNSIRKVEINLPESGTNTSLQNQAIQQILKGKNPISFTNKEEAMKNVKELTNFLANKGKSIKEQQGTGGKKTHWECELEINDFPQQSRWKVTQKDALSEIADMTETSILTKGTYVLPGRKPPLGQKKLYLQIEGPTELSVKLAKKEVFRRLSEESGSEQSMQEKTMYSKYSVL